MRPAFALALSALLALVAPGAALAHLRSGRTAVDYRADVSTAPPGVTARVFRSDLALGLSVAPGHEAVVLGYLGEPAIRVGAAGVEVNRSSPTAAGSGLLKPPPGRTGGAPRWQRLSSGPTVVWHDARVRGLPPGLTRRHWSVPLVVDGRRAAIGGELVRVPKPSPLPWLALAVGLSKLPALLHGIVLSSLPAEASRAAVAVSVCAGAAAAVLGLVVFFDVLEHYEEPLGGTIRSDRSNSR